MALEPQGAALMVPSELPVLTDCMGTTGWLGRNGARWAFLKRSRQKSNFFPLLTNSYMNVRMINMQVCKILLIFSTLALPLQIQLFFTGEHSHVKTYVNYSYSFLHSNRSHPGSSSTMRDAEGLVQVEMRDIRAIVSRATQTHLYNRPGKENEPSDSRENSPIVTIFTR